MSRNKALNILRDRCEGNDRHKEEDEREDQWEYFINGIGRGISIQLVSEEIDPGN